MGHALVDASPLSEFERAVKRVVAAIPEGTVLAYGEVALLAGRPGGARAVVKALHRLSGIPWWRVVRADRTVAKEIAGEQAPRLRAEGVQVVGLRIRGTRASQGPAGGPGPTGRAAARKGAVRPRAQRVEERRATGERAGDLRRRRRKLPAARTKREL